MTVDPDPRELDRQRDMGDEYDGDGGVIRAFVRAIRLRDGLERRRARRLGQVVPFRPRPPAMRAARRTA